MESGIGNVQDTGILEILDRYEQSVSKQKKSYDVEKYRIQTIRKSEWAKKTIRTVSAFYVAVLREERLKLVQPASVQRELVVLSHVFTMAIREWGYELLNNSVSMIRKPPPLKPRIRRLESGEEQRIWQRS